MEAVTTKQEMIQWFHSQITLPEKNGFRTRFWKEVLKIATRHGDAFIAKKDAEPLGGAGIVRGAAEVPKTSVSKRKQRKLPSVA